MYIRDGVVVVNNKIDNKLFLYDKNSHLEYAINEGMFDILERIDHKCKVDSDILHQLIDLRILTEEEQRFCDKIKVIDNYNMSRIFIECTSQCNLRCKHCYGDFKIENSDSLSIERFEEIIAEAARLNIYQVDITGGEPLLYKDFNKMCQLLFKYGMLTHIFTNLTACDDVKIDIIDKYGIKTVITSIESLIPAIHDEFRGMNGALNKTIENIFKLKEKGIEVKVNIVIGEHNYSEVMKIIDYFNNKGVDCVVDITTPWGRAQKGRDYSELITALLKSGLKMPDMRENCGVGERMIFVSSVGKVYPCPNMLESQFLLGEVDGGLNLEDCFFKTFKLFEKFKCNIQCGRNCSGGCRARALLNEGSIYAKDKVFCKLFDK